MSEDSAKKKRKADESCDLEALPRMIRSGLKTLEEREKSLRRAIELFKREKEDFGSVSDPGDVLHLNVGGAPLAVLRGTLTSIEGSMLASRFSGRWDESIEKDRDGNFFVDQPIELFKPMVDYLRAKACETPLAPPVATPKFGNDDVMRRDFARMVEFYGMTPGIYPTVVEMYIGKPENATVTGRPEFSVSSRDWATFALQLKGHDRKIKSFEVTLGDVERAQIGWAWINRSDGMVRNLTQVSDKGVGHFQYSIALDCFRSGLLVQGSLTQIEDLSFGEGTVVRCENMGQKWLVNGEVVASITQIEGVKLVTSGVNSHITSSRHKFAPTITGKGQWRITQVELADTF